MALTPITFKSTNISVEDRLKQLVTDKFSSLEKFIGTAPNATEVEFSKNTAHQHGDICNIEANMTVNGKLFRAQAMRDTFEKAVDDVRDGLEREITRAHEKRDTLVRRGGRMLKNMFNLGQ